MQKQTEEIPDLKVDEPEKIIPKKKKTIFIICIILFILFIFSVIFAILNMNKNTFLEGISINGIDVSNLSKEEAKSSLEEIINNKLNTELLLSYQSTESNEPTENHVDPNSLEITYNLEKTLEEAYNLGKTGNIFQNNFEILSLIIHKKNFEIPITLNEDNLNTLINDISLNISEPMVQNSYYIDGDKLIITKGSSGNSISTQELKEKIYTLFNDFSKMENIIEVPIKFTQADNIDIDKIHSEVYKDPQNAYYEENPLKIYTEVDGVDFDVNLAKEKMKEDLTEYTIDLIITKPNITLNDLDIDIFPDLLASFTTKYDVQNKDRSTNLSLAASKINGTILSPGEEFSYNKIVGERTIAAGYKEAKIYSNGEVIDGLGGGICQISSTLYNATVFANLDITTRRNHQFVTSYVEAGRDATVVYGSQDFKFVNSRKYPIKILVSVESGIAKVSIYGIKEDVEYDISFDIEKVSTIPFDVKYQKDSSLPVGTEKVKQKGVNGLIVKAYKVTKLNGAIVSKTLLSQDTYNSMAKVIIAGTRVIENTTNTTEPNTQSIDSSDTTNLEASNTDETTHDTNLEYGNNVQSEINDSNSINENVE